MLSRMLTDVHGGALLDKLVLTLNDNAYNLLHCSTIVLFSRGQVLISRSSNFAPISFRL